MTSVTAMELKIIYFSIVFVGLMGVFISLYSDSPIEQQSYVGETSISSGLSASPSSWITGLFSVFPAPFDDPSLAIVIALFITPVIIILTPIAIRYVKDLVTQWV